VGIVQQGNLSIRIEGGHVGAQVAQHPAAAGIYLMDGAATTPRVAEEIICLRMRNW
jgi:hypothetical protein